MIYKGYNWLPSYMVDSFDDLDMSYYEKAILEAFQEIEKVGDLSILIGD